MPIVADAAVAVRADMARFGSDLRAGTDAPIKSLGQRIKGVFSPQNLALGAAVLGGLVVAGLANATKALIDIERLNAQTDAAIKSTGGAANVTRQQIEEAAEAAERATTIQRESVQEAQNMLLTFTGIRNEVGEGNDIFTQATEAVLDMSVALGTDATGAAMQLGKALNDPIRGVAQLARAGIQFTDQQKDMIAAMVESGDLLGAQTIILAELETQFGGSAEAFANTTAGKVQRFQNDIGNMFEAVVVGIVDEADKVSNAGEAIGGWFRNLKLDAPAFTKVIERMAGDVGISFQTMKNRITDRMAETGEDFVEASDAIEAHWRTTGGDMSVTTQRTMDSIASTIEVGGVLVRDAARVAITDPLLAEMLEAEENANKSGHQVVIEYAAGLLTPQTDVERAIEAALQVIEDEMSITEELAFLSGQKIVLEEARGIAMQEGKDASVIAIDGALALIEGRMTDLVNDAYDHGVNIVAELARGLIVGKSLLYDPAHQLSNVIRNMTGIESEPKDHSSGLYGITKWGGNIVKTIADGIYGELGGASNAAGSLAAALTPTIGPVGMSLASANGAAGGGDTYLQLVVEGQPKTMRSAREMWSGFEQLSGFSDRSMT